MDKRAMVALSGGHLTTDFGGGALPALIPFLHDRFHLSYLLSAVLILASSVSSSVVQPLFGLWSDRRGALWLLPLGVALSGVGVGLAADAPDYWLVCALVVVSGIGVAAFHPEGSKFAAYASGPAARQRHVGLLRRRERRLRARGGGDGAARRSGSACAAGCCSSCPASPSPPLLVAASPFLRSFAPERAPLRAPRPAPTARARWPCSWR